MDKLITIVVPVYNVEKYIDRCVESIQNQTYKNLEIILVDDGSKDNSAKICDQYAKKDKRIKVVHKKNGGLSDARNAGIEIAKGKYIAFIDSDDYIDEHFVEVLYKSMIQYKTKIAIADICVQYDTGEKFENSDKTVYVETEKEILRKMLIGIRDLDNSACNKLYDMSLFKDIRYPVGRLYEDTATTYKLFSKCENMVINSFPLYYYMKRRDSITQGRFNPKKLQLIDSVSEMTTYVRSKYPELSPECDRKMMWAYLSTLSQLAASSKPDKSIAKKLLKYINANGKSLLKKKVLSKRDKLGIICARFGFGFYRLVWRLYLKLNKKY